MRNGITLGLVAVVAGSLMDCGDTAGPGQTYRVADPAGDVFGTGTVRPDVTLLTIVHDADGISVYFDFTANVQSPVTGGSNVVIGYVDFDTDQDSTTGSGSIVDTFRPSGESTGLGVDYFAELFDYDSAGTVAIKTVVGPTETGRVKPTFQGKRVSFRIPRALLGGDDGFLHAAGVLGSPNEPTDIVPNSRHLKVGTTPPGASVRRTAAPAVTPARAWPRRSATP